MQKKRPETFGFRKPLSPDPLPIGSGLFPTPRDVDRDLVGWLIRAVSIPLSYPTAPRWLLKFSPLLLPPVEEPEPLRHGSSTSYNYRISPSSNLYFFIFILSANLAFSLIDTPHELGENDADQHPHTPLIVV